MDDAERIPIDIGYELAGEAAESANPAITQRADGTLVIDLIAQACQPEPSTEPEIVVCAQSPTAPLQPLPPPPDPTPMDILAEAFSAKVGPVEINPANHPAGTAGIGIWIRF